MPYNGDTKLTDVLAQHPWLPDELIKMDGRFKIVKTPIGKMMIKNATIKDLCAKTGLSQQETLDKLHEMIRAHDA